MGTRLDSAAKTAEVRGRRVVVRRFLIPPSPGECHLLFVGNDYARRLPELLGHLGKSPILLVGDTKGFASDGGAIGFVEKDGAIHFEVNLGSADHTGIKLGTGLLKLADKVYKSEGTPSP